MTLIVLSAVGTEPYLRMVPPQLGPVMVDVRGTTDFDSFAAHLDARRPSERIAILGHSILGMLAIEYGRRHPERVSLVVLAGTPPNGDMTALAARSEAFFERDASEDRKGAGTETAKRFFDPHTDVAALYAGATFDAAFFAHLLGTLAPSWDVRRNAHELAFPILIAHGRYDYVVPYDMWNGIPERLPNATFRLFARSAHHTFCEEPDAFVAAIAELSECGGSPPL